MSFLRGYRGLFRELQNTGSVAALSLQVKTGVLHVLRSLGRRRPDDGLGARTYHRGDGTSFPSGHASTIMQVATVLSHHVEQRWIDVLLYGLAGTVLFQRIDAEKHWASDVWIGAAWGWGVARTVVDDGERRGGGAGGPGVGLSVARGPAGPTLVLSVPVGGS